MDIRKESLKKHYEWSGKIEVVTRCPLETREDMSLAYTPGVAEACLEIEKDVNKSFQLTRRNNLVAVIPTNNAVTEDIHIQVIISIGAVLPADIRSATIVVGIN